MLALSAALLMTLAVGLGFLLLLVPGLADMHTHLFADGGRVIKSHKRDYSAHVSRYVPGFVA